MYLRVLTLAFSLLFSALAYADKPPVYSHSYRGAVKGVDVVAYYSLPAGAKAVKGDKKITHKWRGATWRFSSIENKEKFAKEPDKYAPQYGGYCAYAVAHGFLAPPRPNSWKIVDGKLYLNNNKTSYKNWEKDQNNKIVEANNNWPQILNK